MVASAVEEEEVVAKEEEEEEEKEVTERRSRRWRARPERRRRWPSVKRRLPVARRGEFTLNANTFKEIRSGGWFARTGRPTTLLSVSTADSRLETRNSWQGRSVCARVHLPIDVTAEEKPRAR